ncbi:MAG: IclR family transcriptional regulator [Thermomicrobiales bacterium]
MVGMKTSRQPAAKSQTVERAASILTCFSAETPHLSLATIADRLGFNQSTAYRYVSTLEAAGLVERDNRLGGYKLGPRVIELSNVALNQNEVRKHGLEEADHLRDELNVLVSLAVLFEGDVLHIAHAVPDHWPRWHTTVGRRAVAHCTSLGKVLLAYKPWPEVMAVIETYGWRPYTPNSIQDFRQLEEELVAIRERGYAIDREERNRGTICLGAPIRDFSGVVVAALSVSGKADKMPIDSWTEVAPRICEAANRISFRLGYQQSSAYL